MPAIEQTTLPIFEDKLLPASPHRTDRARAPSPSGSQGLLELEKEKSTQQFLKDMNDFMCNVATLTPAKRFELTQKALRDMNALMTSARRDQEAAWLAAREADMRTQVLSEQSSKLRSENERLKKFLHMRDEKLQKEKDKSKLVNEELKVVTSQLSEITQRYTTLQRRLDHAVAEVETKAKEYLEMQGKYREAKRIGMEQKRKIAQLEDSVFEKHNGKLEAEKMAEKSKKELGIAKHVESMAWSATVKTRGELLERLDTALMLNPNHFSDFNLSLHHDHSMIVSPGAVGRTGGSKGSPSKSPSKRVNSPFLNE